MSIRQELAGEDTEGGMQLFTEDFGFLDIPLCGGVDEVGVF